MINVEELEKRARTLGRRMIKPTVVVESKTAEGKRENKRAVRRVIVEHHEVLAALKNR